MRDKMTLKVSHPMKIRSIRNQTAEDIAKKHIREFFFRGKNYPIIEGDKKIEICFEVIDPMKNLMKDLRKLFRRTKVKGWIGEYRKALVKLVTAITEMSVTPDLALILQVLVWKGISLDFEKYRCDIALVEIKRGKAGLRDYQKKDVQKAREKGIPYYLLRVDDLDFLRGNFTLTLEQLTPELQLSVP